MMNCEVGRMNNTRFLKTIIIFTIISGFLHIHQSLFIDKINENNSNQMEMIESDINSDQSLTDIFTLSIKP